MPIDTSMYQTIRAPEAPNILDAATKAATLSQLGMQNQQMQYQMQTQQAMRQAYANNVGPDGQVNRSGLLSDLGKINPQAAMEMSKNFNAMDKAKADTQAAQADSAMKTLQFTGPAFDYMAKLPEADRAAAYPKVLQQLKDQGIDVSKMDHPYDSGMFNQYYGSWQKSKPALENYLTEANIQKTNSEVGEKAKGRMTDYQKMLQGNEEWKKQNGMLVEGKNTLTAIDDALKNPQSAAEIPIMLARFTTAGQRMNQTEIEQGVAKGSFGPRLQQMYTKATQGVWTPEYADYARQFVTTQMESAAKNKSDIEGQVSKLYAINTGVPGVAAHYEITGNLPGATASVPSGPQRFAKNNQSQPGRGMSLENTANAGTQAVSPPKGMIRMQAPDGKIRLIPEAMKGEAIAAGGRVVK